MTFNEQKTIHGFTVTEKTYIKELSATAFMAEHTKSGARLLFLDRADRNMTFSIAFRTPPEDDSGVFHIIEHSVLCGSRKFPVKEPFVELLKSSLNTFLNAMTYDDRTVYPVSSRCERDFLNLVDVYLDAVFHPLMLTDRRIFMQEGGHLEYKDGELSYNGVVYNEMKGAYSSPDELATSIINRTLFEGSPYAYDSGGVPEAIEELTYEQFVTAHKRYYHPSNSYIFLDGSIDLDKTLSLIDFYLSEYEKKEIIIEFPKHAPLSQKPVTQKYEATEAECAEGRARLVFSFVFSDFSNVVEDNATALIESVLTGSNEAPLKRVMLESGLIEDMSVSIGKSRENTVSFELYGVLPENIDRARELFYSTVKDISERGIDRERLSATLDNVEFKMREGDFGTLPKGVAYALAAYSSWIYGRDPAKYLGYEDTLAELRRLSEGRYYEQLLSRMVTENDYRFELTLIPDRSAGEENLRAARERMQRRLSLMTPDALRLTEDEKRALDEWQSTPDSQENLNTVPVLSLSDVPKDPEITPSEERSCRGVRIIRHPINTGGITYATLYFSDPSLPEEDLYFAMLLSLLYKNLPTSRHRTENLQSLIKGTFGSLAFSFFGLSRLDSPDIATPTLSVSLSLLDSKRDAAAELLSEILNETLFTDTAVLRRILVQIRSSMEESFSEDALSYSLSRVFASVSAGGAVSERVTGYDSYITVRELLSDFDNNGEEILSRIRSVAKRIITRAGLTVSVSGTPCAEFEEKFANVAADAPPSPEPERIPPHRIREGMCIPSTVAFTALGGLLPEAREMLGALKVVRSILSYEYLWREVRVKGGAYGAGFITRKSGELGFYSYRDPSPESTLSAFAGAADYLRELADSGADLTRFIIGAFGEYDIITTPRTASAIATRDILVGWSDLDERRLREGMLSFGRDDLLRAADLIDRLMVAPSVSVAGPEHMLTESGTLQSVIKI